MSPSVPEGTNSHKAFSMLFSAGNPPTAACFESMTLLDAAEPQVPFFMAVLVVCHWPCVWRGVWAVEHVEAMISNYFLLYWIQG